MSYTFASQYGPDDLSSKLGVPQPNTAFTVNLTGTNTPATLYTNAIKSGIAGNPGMTDSLGNLLFFADPGVYDVVADSSTFTVVLDVHPLEWSSGTPSATNPPSNDNSQRIATTSFVEAAVQAASAVLNPKNSVVVFTGTNQALTGLPTIDTVTLTDSQRLLLVGQTNAVQNGIWLVHSGAWTRPTDFASGSSQLGSFVFVTSGATGAGEGWVLSSTTAITVDTSPQTWVQFSAAESGGLLAVNNLSDVSNAATALNNLGILNHGQGWVQVTGLTDDAFATDQTSVITTAENLLPAAGGWLVFPKGQFGCANWTPKTGTNLWGAGGGTQGTDGATTLGIPVGNTTAASVVNFANSLNVVWNVDFDGQSRGMQDPGGKSCACAVLVTGQDQTFMNCHMEGGSLAAFQSITNGVGRSRLFNVITEGLGGTGLVRTISGTCTLTKNSNVLQDSAGSFTAADVGRGVSANPANTAGVPLGTRLNNFTTIRTGTAANVSAIVSAGTINLWNNNHILATGQLSVMTSQGPTTFNYSGLTGSGATTQLTGVTYASGATGTGALVAAGASAGFGAVVTNTTQIMLDQAFTATTVTGTATVGIIQNYTAIIGSTDTQCTECRFVQGTTVVGNETNSSATQWTNCHFTNTLTSVENAGGVLFEGSANQWGCYYDTVPPNGSAIIHKTNVKQVAISSAYTFNNQSSNPWWYTENDNTTGITIRGVIMAPPNGTWAGLANLAGGTNLGVNIKGIHAVDSTVFAGTTLASLFTGASGISTAKPFGCGQVEDIYFNNVRMDPGIWNPITLGTSSWPYTANPWDTIFATAGSVARTLTLPSSPQLGVQVRIKRMDAGSGAITVVGTVDGVTNPTMTTQYADMWLEWNGSSWNENATTVSGGGASPVSMAAQAMAATNVTESASIPQLTAASSVMDGYTVQANDVVLLTGQTNAVHNGLWQVPSSGSNCTRPSSFPSGGIVYTPAVRVVNGGIYANSAWTLPTTTAGETIDTSSQTWVMQVQAPVNLDTSSTAVNVSPNSTNVFVGSSPSVFTLPGSTAATVAAPAPYLGCRVTISNLGTATVTIAGATVVGSQGQTVRPGKSLTLVYEVNFVNLDWYPVATGVPAEPVFNVVDYGADPSAFSDSTAAIQAAINDAGAAGGGTVYFPAGTYSLATVTNDTCLTIGNGSTVESVIWTAASAGASTVVLASGTAAFTNNGATITGVGGGTTFTLTWNGHTTSSIAANASAATIQTALQALTGGSAITCTGGPLQTSPVIVANLAGHALTVAGTTPPTVAALLNYATIYTGTLSGQAITYTYFDTTTNTGHITLQGVVGAPAQVVGFAVCQGTNTATTPPQQISTYNGITLRGAGQPGDPGEGFTAPTVTLRYAAAAGHKVITIAGPIQNIALENLWIECSTLGVKAAFGIYATTLVGAAWRNVFVANATNCGYLFTGVTTGFGPSAPAGASNAGASATITNITANTTTITFSTSPNNTFVAGQLVTFTNLNGGFTTLNGTNAFVASSTGGTFTVTNPNFNTQTGSSGTASIVTALFSGGSTMFCDFFHMGVSQPQPTLALPANNGFSFVGDPTGVSNGTAATITNMSGTGSVVTITANNTFYGAQTSGASSYPGQVVVLSGITEAHYLSLNGSQQIVSATPTTFTISATNSGTFSGGGTATPATQTVAASAGVAFCNMYGVHASQATQADLGGSPTTYQALFNYAFCDDTTFHDVALENTASPATHTNYYGAVYDYTFAGGGGGDPSVNTIDGFYCYGTASWTANTTNVTAIPFAPNVVKNVKSNFQTNNGTNNGPSAILQDPNVFNLNWQVPGGEMTLKNNVVLNTVATSSAAFQLDPARATTLILLCTTADVMLLQACATHGGSFNTLIGDGLSNYPVNGSISVPIPAGWWVKITTGTYTHWNMTVMTRVS